MENETASQNDKAHEALDLDKLAEIAFDDRPAPAALLQKADGMSMRPFTLMRSKVQQKLKDHDITLIGITSATPSVGKSTLSIALAASLEKVADVPVFLIDLDLRRASIAEYLGLDVGYGMSDYLADTSIGLQSVAVRIAESDLVILPTRARSGPTAELLAGAALARLTKSLRSMSPRPICIFDLPPAFANDDTMISLGSLDGYFLVVESGETSKRHILDVLKILAPANCFGTILNRYDGTIGDSYSYGGALYSRYYE